jgi:hypothetical protein
MYKRTMHRGRCLTNVLFLTFPLLGALSAQTPAVTIRIVEGDRAINSIKLRRAHEAVVQVVSANGESLSGVPVTFLLPASGPGASFADGSLSQTVQTDGRGMASTRGIKPNRLEGQFRIRVTTSWRGESASASILQTNAEPVAKSSSSKWVVIAVVVGGAAAGGVVAATHGGGSQSNSGSTGANGSSTIVPGTPSFGPPR